jgi:hypothetical protein
MSLLINDARPLAYALSESPLPSSLHSSEPERAKEDTIEYLIKNLVNPKWRKHDRPSLQSKQRVPCNQRKGFVLVGSPQCRPEKTSI